MLANLSEKTSCISFKRNLEDFVTYRWIKGVFTFSLLLQLYSLCMWLWWWWGSPETHHTGGDQRTMCRSRFSPSTRGSQEQNRLSGSVQQAFHPLSHLTNSFCCLLACFGVRVSLYSPGWPQTWPLLLLPPGCLDYRCAPWLPAPKILLPLDFSSRDLHSRL